VTLIDLGSTTAERTPFGGLTVLTGGSVLVPRPWTVAQAHWAVALLDEAPAGPVAELCCGAGHIGLEALRRHPDRRLVLVDRDEEACRWARTNADLNLPGCQVEVRHADLDEPFAPDERFALVLGDPPYVPADEVDQHDGHPQRIDGGDDGLAVVRDVLALGVEHLLPGGHLLLQLGGGDQVDAVAEEIQAGGVLADLVDVRTYGDDRAVVHLRRPDDGR
jgi:methylase of polypeptide subunit release factors